MIRFYNMTVDPALPTIKQRKVDMLVSVQNTIESAFEDRISILVEENPKNMSKDVEQIREMLTFPTCRTSVENFWKEPQIRDVAHNVRESLNNQGNNWEKSQKNELFQKSVSAIESLHQVSRVLEINIGEEIGWRISSGKTVLKNMDGFVVALEDSFPKIIRDSDARIFTSFSNILVVKLGVARKSIRSGTSILQLQIDRLASLCSSLDGKLHNLIQDHENHRENSVNMLPRWVYTAWVIAASTGLLEIGFLLYGVMCICRKSSNNFFVS